MLISSFISSFFFLSNKNLCHRFLSSCWRQSLQILYTLRGWPSLLCKEIQGANNYFAFFFNFSFFTISHSYVMHMTFSVKDFSGTAWLRILKFCTKLWYDKLYCVLNNQPHILISPFISSFFFLSNKKLCHRFLSSCWSQSLQILYTLRGWPSILCKRNSRC